MLTQLCSLGSVLKDIPQFFVQVSHFDITCLSFALTSPIFTLSTTRNWTRMTYKNERSLWSSLFSEEKMCLVLFHVFFFFCF